jgi:peptide/nickel transport system ATP-binding protein
LRPSTGQEVQEKRGGDRAMDEPLLEVDHLTKHFPVTKSFLARLIGREAGAVHAVDDVSLAVRKGETFGLVGESGCGKTTLGRLMLRLVDPTAGTIRFEGRDVTTLGEAAMRPLRARMQLVFQDPHASLNPSMSVGDAVAHPLVVHGMAGWREARERAAAMLEEVGLAPAERFFGKRPAELSGGQKQRVVIARAVVTRPSFIVADEPVSMLDMSVRAKILDVLLDLKKKYGLTLVFITHDLATARFLCDRLAIMYLGQVVEMGDARRILAAPEHPYSQALVKAIPEPDPDARRIEAIARGEVPDAVHPPAGCRFHPRCPVATPRCGFTGADLADAVEMWEERVPESKADTSALRRGLSVPLPAGNDPEGFERDAGAPIVWVREGHDVLVPTDALPRIEHAARRARPVVWEALARQEASPKARTRLAFDPPAGMDLRRRPDGRVTRCIHCADEPPGGPG